MGEKINFYYTVLEITVIFISLLYSVYYRNFIKNTIFKFLPIYTAVSLTISLIWLWKSLIFFGPLISNLFIPFEFFIFYNLYFKIFEDTSLRKKLIKIVYLFSISILLVLFITFIEQNEIPNFLNFITTTILPEIVVIQNICIVLPALYYYKLLFNPPYSRNLINNPLFLVMTGTLFCFAIAIPVYAFQKLILPTNREFYLILYVVNALSYMIMHLFFIKAYIQLKNG